MPTPKVKDEALVASLAGHLVDAMSMFPKRLVRTDELIHSFGMPLSHMQILVMLEKGDMSIGQLSTYTGVAKPNVTPLVDVLCERGYVSRARDQQDRRMMNVHLEEEGAACLRELREAVAAQVRAWPDRIGRGELRSLDGSLADMVRVMEALGDPREP